jgi:hypothetical protein
MVSLSLFCRMILSKKSAIFWITLQLFEFERFLFDQTESIKSGSTLAAFLPPNLPI